MSEQAIAARNARLIRAVADNDASAAASCYTQEAKFMAPNAEPFAGRTAIQRFFQAAFDGGLESLGLETLTVEILGDTAWEEGLYELHGVDNAVTDRGKFIVVWKRVGDEWLLHRDIISTNQPAS
jgi:uncharacterized protein (TIGR02246 family)